jgi:homocysteine S-methyltransferase
LSSQPFLQLLARGTPVLLDGGLATELEAQGHDIGTTLWSAELLRSNPQAIVRAHRAYLDAGAECIISASYQASRQGFGQLGFSAQEADRLIASAIELANEARDGFVAGRTGAGPHPLVAASVGPYGAALHDGSEYRGRYGVGKERLRAFHEARLRLLDASGADVLACETIPDSEEAEVLAELLQSARTPAWVSFSCRDERSICDGTPLADMAAHFAVHPTIKALGVNCTAPQYVEPLIREIRRSAPDKAVVVYPNSGEQYDARRNRWLGTVTPLDCAAAAGEWLAAGATLIGGCCRMGPAHIAAMKTALRDRPLPPPGRTSVTA